MSESNSGWYLRHRDGVEHGPFQVADLIAAAKAGNIASDTVLRHEVHSHNQWVFATRVQPVAEAMTRPKSRSDQQTSPSKSSRKQPAAQAASAKQAASAAQVPSAARTEPDELSPASPSVPSSAPLSRPVPEAVTTVPATTASLQPVHRPIMHGSGFPVPKTFFEAVLALFDFRFQRFVTPWIIQIGWVLAVALTLCSAAALTYTTVIGPTAPSSAETSSAEMGESDRGNWQFDPLAGQALLESEVFRFGIGVFFLGFGLLGARLLCEAAIIFFRIAIDVRELKATSREREKAGMD
jgi:hypothetical protein